MLTVITKSANYHTTQMAGNRRTSLVHMCYSLQCETALLVIRDKKKGRNIHGNDICATALNGTNDPFLIPFFSIFYCIDHVSDLFQSQSHECRLETSCIQNIKGTKDSISYTHVDKMKHSKNRAK